MNLNMNRLLDDNHLLPNQLHSLSRSRSFQSMLLLIDYKKYNFGFIEYLDDVLLDALQALRYSALLKRVGVEVVSLPSIIEDLPYPQITHSFDFQMNFLIKTGKLSSSVKSHQSAIEWRDILKMSTQELFIEWQEHNK